MITTTLFIVFSHRLITRTDDYKYKGEANSPKTLDLPWISKLSRPTHRLAIPFSANNLHGNVKRNNRQTRVWNHSLPLASMAGTLATLVLPSPPATLHSLATRLSRLSPAAYRPLHSWHVFLPKR